MVLSWLGDTVEVRMFNAEYYYDYGYRDGYPESVYMESGIATETTSLGPESI